MQKVPFTFQEREFDFVSEHEAGDLIKITCYHDIYKSVFGDFTKKFHFFGDMIQMGMKKNPDFFEAMKHGMLAFEKAKEGHTGAAH